MTHSKGISWIDDCRIPFVDEKDPNISRYAAKRDSVEGMFNRTVGFKGEYDYKEQTGRFPANLLVCDDMLNDGVISKSVKGRNDIGGSTYGGNSLLNSKTKMNNTDRGFNDKGSNSRYYDIDKWFDKIINYE
jgi:hypothetical protein